MKACLLLVDLQNDYFGGGNMELVNMEQAAENARRLLRYFRRGPSPVLHVQHIAARPDATFFLPETAGVEIHEMVSPGPGEKVVQKHFPNSFRETELLELLQQAAVDTLLICGAMSHMCIDATTRAAFDYGFNCVVAEDACATRDLMFKGKTVAAENVHASFMAALATSCAQVLGTGEAVDYLEK